LTKSVVGGCGGRKSKKKASDKADVDNMKKGGFYEILIKEAITRKGEKIALIC